MGGAARDAPAAVARRIPFELAVFALAAVALATVSVVAAVGFAAAVALNAVLLTAFEQWES